MEQLHWLASELLVEPDQAAALDLVVGAAMRGVNAQFGDLQLFDPADNSLLLVSSSGLDAWFVEHYRRVGVDHDTVCANALRTRTQVLVEDVFAESGYPGLQRFATHAGFSSVESTPLLTRAGEFLGVLSTMSARPRRLTEREAQWLDLCARQAADYLEAHRTRTALQAVADELKDLNLRKDQFLATLAHELRNPLAPIRNGLDLLKLQVGGECTEAHKVITMVLGQVEHMVRLVDDLMDVGRIVRGNIALSRTAVDLRDIVARVVEVARPMFEGGERRLLLALPELPVLLSGDAHRLTQILGNLLNNAYKFTRPGGTVEVALSVAAGQAELRVRDDGIGIEHAQLERIFEMFAQVDSSLEREHGGLGLGLSLVRQMVELHGGSVEARSGGQGQGSEFIVRVPVDGQRPQQAEATTADRMSLGLSPGSGVRVLLVDDNREAATVLKAYLEREGFDARVCFGGTEAVALCGGWQPDAIVMDIGMPGLNGYEACRRIRAQWGGSVRMIALTGWGEPEARQRALEAGFDALLVKPVDAVGLLALLAVPAGPMLASRSVET
jgi:signal transduction histidine kinase/ActR/RegA family two-component response regulator